jgi:hypothetical protein
VDSEEYDDLATRVLRLVLRREVAMVWHEIEAKISDYQAPESHTTINPHHLTNARKLLTHSGELRAETSMTKGGHKVETFSLIDTPESTAEPVAATKRALHARYLGWAMGTRRYPNGLIGPAAEKAVDDALMAATATGVGYFPLPKTGREVTHVFNEPVPTGPLDAAAFYTPLDQTGIPSSPTLIPIEVKNVRSWIYPSAHEIYQLLEKASLLQRAKPNLPIVPVFVCRRANYQLFRMAKHLGFYVVQAPYQYLLDSSEVKPDELREVQEVLGYRDLVQSSDTRLIANHFSKTLPTVAGRSSHQWHQTAFSELPRLFRFMRRETLTARDRGSAIDQIRQIGKALPGPQPDGW